MNLFDVFRRAEACAEQEQAGKQCGSNEVDFSHAVFGGGRQMTIGPASAYCKASSAGPSADSLLWRRKTVTPSQERRWQRAVNKTFMLWGCLSELPYR